MVLRDYETVTIIRKEKSILDLYSLSDLFVSKLTGRDLNLVDHENSNYQIWR